MKAHSFLALTHGSVAGISALVAAQAVNGGFSPVSMLLAGLIVAIVVGVAWFVSLRLQQALRALQNAAKQNSQKVEPVGLVEFDECSQELNASAQR